MSLDDLLLKIFGTGGGYYINSILETDNAYCIHPTDKFGNDIDELPLVLYKDTFIPCADEMEAFDVELHGVECEIPEKYASDRVKVQKMLIEKCKSSNDAVSKKHIKVAVDSLFFQGYCEYSLDELYSVCSYLLDLVKTHCSEEDSILTVTNYKEIEEFFNLTDEEKLRRSQNHS